jgi:hypothetical protein
MENSCSVADEDDDMDEASDVKEETVEVRPSADIN